MSIEKTKQLKIFIAYTFDCDAECKSARSIAKECPTITEICRYFGLSVDVLDWSQVFPDAERPQSLINDAIQKFDPDWLIFIFWHRFGSDAGLGKTGIEEEWSLSLKLKKRGQGKPNVTVYFNGEEPPNFQIDNDQQKALLAFQGKMFSEHQALASKFNGTHDFEKKFRGHLTHMLLSFQPPTPGNKYNLPEELFSASRGLLTWPSSLSNGKWIDRPELQRIHQKIQSELNSTTLVLGEPGSGKSALLAKIGNKLADAGTLIFAIKADFLSNDISTQEALRDALNLSLPPQNCLLAIAASKPVVLLIDQLDALADLVDLHSGRLDVLLNLIHSVADQKNIHIVLSCRTFEHKHDPRLRHLDLDIVDLESPSWETVSEILKGKNINPEGWPTDYQETLRIPQNLKIFLDVNKGEGEHNAAQSYHTLMEKLWKQKVLSDPENRPKLLEDMAIEMGKREELWLPSIRYEKHLNLIDSLIAEDILIRTDDDKKVGFRHQTFFEYARARAFIKREGSLFTTVLERQDALFIRALLWNALRYLREADCSSYLHEFESLWNCDALRRHIKSLLIDFLGQLPQPNNREEICLLSELAKNTSNRYILSSVSGSPGWFSRLEKQHLPMLMKLPANEAINVLFLLIDAWKFSKDKVFNLLETYWLTDRSKDNLTWRLLGGLNEWTEKPIEICCQILERSNIDASSVNDYTSRVSAILPDEAPKIVATYLRRQLKLARKQPLEAPPILPENPSVDQLVVHSFYKKYKHIEELLESEKSLYDLSAIAEAAPKSFLTELWPWFIDIFRTLANDPHPYITGYREDHLLATGLEDDVDSHFEFPLVSALQTAIQALAKSDLDYFFEFIENSKDEDLMVVQRLFAKGSLINSNDYPSRVLDFLCYDPRRLKLGDRHDHHSDSKKLIAAVTPLLDSSQRMQLEQYICNWSYYYGNPDSDDAQVRFDRNKHNREHRLRLLRSFPKKYMSDEISQYLEEEERAFPDLQDWDIRDIRGGFIGSPVSADQMTKSKDNQLLEIFSEITDSTGSAHPKTHMRGGIIQLAGEFKKFAKESPERVLRLIEKMSPKTNETAVGEAIEGLAESSLSTDTLYAEIKDLLSRGFSSNDFRQSVTSALSEKITKHRSIPKTFFELLESWLEPFEPGEKTNSVENQKEDKSKIQSILWGRGGIRFLPHANYPKLVALTKACLYAEPQNLERWLGILETHLTRTENPKVWQFLMHPFLLNLHLCPHDRAEMFLDQLFDQFPSARDSIEGIWLIANAREWVSETLLSKWLNQLRESSWSEGAQAYGELLCLYHLLIPEKEWPQEQINNILKASGSEKISKIELGLIFTAANMWDHRKSRLAATDILVKLLKNPNEDMMLARSDLFRVSKTFLPDNQTWQILDILCEYPPQVGKGNTRILIEHLEHLVTTDPERVFRLCDAILNRLKNEISTSQHSYVRDVKGITNISLTLQRLDAQNRARGLGLFEQLLEMDIYDAKQALLEIDRRPLDRSIPQPIRQKKRRQG